MIWNWKDVLAKAWSIRLMLIAAMLTGLEVALPLLPPYMLLPDGMYALLTGVVVALALLARLLAQSNLPE